MAPLLYSFEYLCRVFEFTGPGTVHYYLVNLRRVQTSCYNYIPTVCFRVAGFDISVGMIERDAESTQKS